METIIRILGRAGGYRPMLYLKVENPPYMVLVIEAMRESGSLGLPAISIAHYGEQNGDLMCDPEMCFELAKPVSRKIIFDPYYWRNDYVGVEQFLALSCAATISLYRNCTNSISTSPLHGTGISPCKASRKPSPMLPFVASL